MTVMNGSFVEFVLDGRHFALPLENVREIISRPEITPLPMASKHVRGMVNLRGAVIPVVDLAVRLGCADRGQDRDEVLILDMEGLSAGVMVDAASQVAQFDGIDLDQPEEDMGVEAGSVRGVFRHQDRLVILLNPARILSVDRELLARLSQERNADEREGERSYESLRIVTFDLSGENYGFRLDQVREILRYEPPTSVPDAPRFMEGVLQVRGAILPVVNLKDRLGRSGEIDPEKAKILVADYDDFRLGFVADGIREVLDVPLSEVSESPMAVRDNEGRQAVSAIVRHDGEIVTVLDRDGLVESGLYREMASGDEENMEIEKDAGDDGETLVVFRVCNQPFGLPITRIREINRFTGLSRVPGMPDFVEGALDLRGDIVPVASLRKRLCMDSETDHEGGSILVVELGNSLLGLLVDEVVGVIEIPASRISEPPVSMKELGSARDFVSQVARREVEGERMILILSPESVLSEAETISAREAVTV